MLVVDILTQILLTVLTFIALPILHKNTICCRWFLFGVRYYSNFQFTPWRVIMGNNMVSKTWVGMSTTKYLFTPIQSSKSLEKHRLWMPVHQNSCQRKTVLNFLHYWMTENIHSYISYITFAILPFCHKKNLTKVQSWVVWSVLLLSKPSEALQMVHSNTKNAKCRVCQSQVCYTQTHFCAFNAPLISVVINLIVVKIVKCDPEDMVLADYDITLHSINWKLLPCQILHRDCKNH